MSESNTTDRLVGLAERLAGILEQLVAVRACELDTIAAAMEEDGEGEDEDDGVDMAGNPIVVR